MKMDWATLLSKNRLGVNGTADSREGRSEFQRDYDRIVFSHAFRKLQGKTQVHPMPSNDSVHNRLTHSLEVACVGRSLGEMVGLRLLNQGLLPSPLKPSDLGETVQAACLAHDIGNPPFGHTGEAAIRDWYTKLDPKYLISLSESEKKDFLRFEGNAQGFRILSQLECHSFRGGMQLTYATLATFCKYPWGSGSLSETKTKFGIFQSEMPLFREVAKHVGLIPTGTDQWCRHPLTYLVEAADDICYALIDVEDGIELGLVKIEELEEALQPALPAPVFSEYRQRKFSGPWERISYLRGKAMDLLTNAVVNAFMAHYDQIITGTFTNELTAVCEDKVRICLNVFKKKIGEQKIYAERDRLSPKSVTYKIFESVLNACQQALQNPSPGGEDIFSFMEVDAPSAEESLYTQYLKINDFVSGLTDGHITKIAHQLNQPSQKVGSLSV